MDTYIPGKNTLPTSKRRLIAIVTVFCLFLSYLITSLVRLQVLKHEYYRDKVYDQITTSAPLRAKRGDIYDANGNLLATDRTVWRVFVSSRAIRQHQREEGLPYSKTIAKGLSEILGLDASALLTKISNTNVLDITIKKGVEELEYRKLLSFIRDNRLEDMVFTEASSARYYPSGTFAAHLLGFTGSDNQGLYGLEYSYDDVLAGEDGYYLYARDANGNAMPSGYQAIFPAKDGCSLVTTIDSYVQEQLESQLQTILQNHSVQNRVTGIVMDTQSGAILAMATSSPFDPNDPYTLDSVSAAKLAASPYKEGSEEYAAYKRELMEIMWSNKAVTETYEPGSTFKIVTVSTALETGAAVIGDRFSCHGYYTVGGWRIKCHKVKGHGSGFTLAYGLQMSCNPTMMQISERIGAERFYEYVEKFGYFEKTGIDLPSEAGTIFHKLENMGPTELATASFGQRFKVTVIGQLTAIAAVANGGNLVTPYVVQKVLDADKNVVREHETAVKRRVISKEVAQTVAQVLEEGVSGGGGAKNAYVDGYKVAAKTGTSQKFDVLDANGNSYLRIGSTVAFAPSDESGIAVIIVVDEPTCAVKYGSVVAAPYVSALLTNILPYLGYPSNAAPSSVSVDRYTGLALGAAQKKLRDAGIAYEVIGDGDVVLSQMPMAGEKITPGVSKVLLYTSEQAPRYGMVPNLVGKTLNEANALLVNAGFNLKIDGPPSGDGSAVVTAQSAEAGIALPRGTVITLQILYEDFED